MQRIGTTKSFAQHKHINRGERIDAMQVLCSASAQQNHLHNTSTAIEEKAIVLFKCCAAHRHNKIICTTQAQQSRKKRCCYSSVVQRIGTTKLFAQHKHSNRGKAMMLCKCYAAHRNNKIICTTPAQQSRGKRLCYSSVMQRIGTTKSFAQHQHSNRGKSDAAIQVLCSASAQQNYLHNTSTAIEEKAMLLFKCCAAHRHNKIICTAQAQQSRESDDAMQVLCSASEQQNHLHNTSTAIEGKAIVLFKCYAAHRHNKIICTTPAQQSRKKRCCYSSVVQRIGTTKLFAQHKHSNRGKAMMLCKCYAAHRHNKIIRTTPAQHSREKRWCYSSVVQHIGTTKSCCATVMHTTICCAQHLHNKK